MDSSHITETIPNIFPHFTLHILKKKRKNKKRKPILPTYSDYCLPKKQTKKHIPIPQIQSKPSKYTNPKKRTLKTWTDDIHTHGFWRIGESNPSKRKRECIIQIFEEQAYESTVRFGSPNTYKHAAAECCLAFPCLPYPYTVCGERLRWSIEDNGGAGEIVVSPDVSERDDETLDRHWKREGEKKGRR